MVCTSERLAPLLQALEANVSPARRAHCYGTAACAALLCLRHGLDAEKGHLAGLVHDRARELPPAELIGLAEIGGSPVTDWERDAPVLLHGRAAAGLLRERLALADPEVLGAVFDHVTGRAGMPSLSKVLFCADFLEPGRDFVEDALRERALELPLDEATALVLERVFEYLQRAGMRIAPPAIDLYEELRGDDAKKA